MKLRKGMPLWLIRTHRRATRYPSLRGAVAADIVIVGGGLTGATIAWTFASAGIRVALLESALVGQGSTAANSALLMQEPDEDLSSLAKRYGSAAARRIWQLGRKATHEFVATLRRLRIPCELHECDSVYYATRRELIPRLQREHRRRRAA